MDFRIGVNSGDVMVEGEQIYGDGVNVAARLENLADPGGIYISGTVYEQVRDKLALSYEDLGDQAVKNIARPVRVWRVKLDSGKPLPRRPVGRILRRGGALSLAGIAISIATFVFVQHLSLKPQRTSASISPQGKPGPPLPSIPSIAVLPFTNLSDDLQQEYFSDGIANQLIEDLSHLPGLFVIARNSSFAQKGKAIKEQELGRELGVEYLLEGTVQKSVDRIRIGVELVDAASGAEMWTQRFDRPLKDVFAVQDEIVERVVTTVGLILKGEEAKVPHLSSRWPTKNLEAYDALLRADKYWSRFTKDDWVAARHWNEKAIALDPKSADAYASLAAIYEHGVLFGFSQNPQADLDHASELAQQALALDDSNSLALSTLCEIHGHEKRFDQAITEGERAVALNPNSAVAYMMLGLALNIADRPEESVHAEEKAMRLDPSRPDFYALFIGQAYVNLGRYQEAIPLIKRHLALYPNNPWAQVYLIVAYSELGRDQEARAEATELKRINPQFFNTSGVVARHPHFENDLRKAGLM